MFRFWDVWAVCVRGVVGEGRRGVWWWRCSLLVFFAETLRWVRAFPPLCGGFAAAVVAWWVLRAGGGFGRGLCPVAVACVRGAAVCERAVAAAACSGWGRGFFFSGKKKQG